MDEEFLDDLSECYMEADNWDDEQVWECNRKAIHEGDMERMGSGANRSVWAKGDTVYKFSKFDPEEIGSTHVYGNKREVELFYEADPELRAHLAAPKDWRENFSWVAFHRYPDEGSATSEDAEDLIHEFGWECTDISSHEVSGDDRNFVITDYEYCSPEGIEII